VRYHQTGIKVSWVSNYWILVILSHAMI